MMINEFLQRLLFHSGILKRLFFGKLYEMLFKVGSNCFFAIINDGIKCFMTHVFTIVDYRRNIRFLQGLDVGLVSTKN